MKKLFISLAVAISLFAFSPLQSYASTVRPAETTITKTVEIAKAKSMYKRLDEIKALDRSKMSATEKKALRLEVQDIKTQMNQLGGGVYISVGGLLLIIILLIILL